LRHPARRAARPRPALARRRGPHGAGPARAGDGLPPRRGRARAAQLRVSRAFRTTATMGGVIDWTLASQVARGVARLQPAGDPAPFELLDGPAEESERLVSAYTGLVPATPVPTAEAVGRDEWVDANLRSLKGVLE